MILFIICCFIWSMFSLVSFFFQLKKSKLNRWMMSVNHKDISTLYMFLSLTFSIVSSSMSSIIRAELMVPSTNIVTNHMFNVMVTSHSIIMVFFFIMPYLISSFSNWLIPLLCCTPDMSFPRMNNFSFWLLLPASCMIMESVVAGSVSSSWTIYPPLSSSESSVDWAILSLHAASISSILSSSNFLVTMLLNSPKGSLPYHASLFLWCMVITAFMLLTTLPVLASAITMILFDRHFNTNYFDYSGSSDPVLFQHLFWFFSHPEVYVLILPSFGVLSHVIEFNISDPMSSYHSMVWSIMSISFLSFVVWAHHMYSVSMDTDSKIYFSTATIMISIPTSVKVFTWISNIMEKDILSTIPLLWSVLFIWLFTISSVTSLVLSNASVDLMLHDTYFVVAHFHYVLSMGATSAVIMSTFHYWPIFTSLSYSDWMSFIFTMVFMTSVNSVFYPMHTLGLESMPRRYINYPPLMASSNKFISYSLLATFIATVSLLYCLKPMSMNFFIISSQWKIKMEFLLSCPTKWHSFEESPKLIFNPNKFL